MIRLTLPCFCLATTMLLAVPRSGEAQLTESILLFGDSPNIQMDDNLDLFGDNINAPGLEWTLRGTTSGFTIRSGVQSSTYLQLTPSLRSVHLGDGASASGDSGTALGRGASAASQSSVAVGHDATASADSGSAMGFDASAGGQFATALGNQSNAFGSHSLAAGSLALASGFGSVAVGYEADATGGSGVAVGRLATAQTGSGTAVGFLADAESTDSAAYGARSKASGDRSTALGYRALATQADTVVLGQITGQNGATANADVAIGTTAPQGPLHIFRDDATQEMLILESDAAGGPQDRAMMDLSNNGGIRFQFANQSLGTAWRFQAATGNQDRFEVTKVGTGRIEFFIDDLGNGFIAGDLDVGGNLLTNVLLPSDRRLKQDVEVIDPDVVLDRVAGLPIAAWEYTDRPGERHIGPMAQDFRAAFGLGSDDKSISVVDASGVALASIQALAARNQALEQEVEALRGVQRKNAELEERLALVEDLMTRLLPQGAAKDAAGQRR